MLLNGVVSVISPDRTLGAGKDPHENVDFYRLLSKLIPDGVDRYQNSGKFQFHVRTGLSCDERLRWHA